ncbi:hypothetical protein Avbf_12971 [Armadillidium vulgare]|nr:hypothetical protein Avbf_12971 [Armadillidium vulgare]
MNTFETTNISVRSNQKEVPIGVKLTQFIKLKTLYGLVLDFLVTFVKTEALTTINSTKISYKIHD